MTDPPPRLTAALLYASLGWPVLPLWWPIGAACACRLGARCGSVGKHPLGDLVPNGSHDATTNELTIRNWWNRFPSANVGIATGNGRMVVDVDAYKTGLTSLEVLEERWGKLPYSVRAASGSGNGSMHIHYRVPDGIRIANNSRGKLGAGIDVRGEGGYVVAPPSLHASGGTYTWLDEGESTPEYAPDWLVRICLVTTKAEDAPPVDDEVVDEDTADRIARWLLPKAAQKVADGMSRHDAWVWFATQCRDNRVPYDMARSYCDTWLDLSRETGRQRQVQTDELERVLRWAYGPTAQRRPPLEVVADFIVQVEDERLGAPALTAPKGEPAAAWMGPGEAIRRQHNIAQRFPTGFAIFDSLLRGGIPRGKMGVLVGRPGSGKTGLALQWAGNIYRNAPEVHVGLFMADEGLGAAVIRMAQHEGFSREDLEAAQPEVLAAAAKALDRYDRIHCFDPDGAGATLEAFVAGMDAVAGEAPQVWVVDSAQVVRVTAAGEKDRRLSTAAVAEYLKREGRRRGATVILLSQSNRAAYKNKREADNADPLSAGAESGALEHMADFLVFMAPDGDEGRVKVQVPKNRVGKIRMTAFWLEWDMHRAIFREVDELQMSAELEAERTERETGRVIADGKKILTALRKRPGGMTARAIREATGWNGVRVAAALGYLEEQGSVHPVENVGRGGGTLWKVGAGGQDDEE